MKNRIIKRLSMLLSLVLLAACVPISPPMETRAALVDSRGEPGHLYNITFTKWVLPDTPPPGFVALMAGEVGGDVGAGNFGGEALQDEIEASGLEHVVANYRINGADYSFTAQLNVTQAGQEVGNTAVITGVVTEGWLLGEKVEGEYTVISCPDKPPLFQCFQGNLHIYVGTKEWHN